MGCTELNSDAQDFKMLYFHSQFIIYWKIDNLYDICKYIGIYFLFIRIMLLYPPLLVRFFTCLDIFFKMSNRNTHIDKETKQKTGKAILAQTMLAPQFRCTSQFHTDKPTSVEV